MCNPFETIEASLNEIKESLRILSEQIGSFTHISSNDKPLATRKQAADFLGISVGTIINLEKSNQLKPIRIGKSVRHDWDQLNDFKELKTKNNY